MKLTHILATVLWLAAGTCLAGITTGDSLEQAVRGLKGGQKAEAMIRLAGWYKQADQPARAEKVLREALSEPVTGNSGEIRPGGTRLRMLFMLSDILLFNQASYDEALKCLMELRESAIRANDTSHWIQASKYLGFNHRFLKNYHAGIRFLDEAIELCSAVADTAQMISSLNEKANALYYLNDEKNSTDARLQALKLAKLSGNRYAENYVSHDIAFMFTGRKEYRKALSYFLLNYQYCLEEGDHRQLAISGINIADMYLALNRPDSAFYYLSMADSLAALGSLIYERLLVYDGLSRYYTATGNYREAAGYLSRYIGLNDTIFNIQKEKQIAEVETMYETERIDRENRLLRQQNRNAIIIFSLVTVFITVIVVLLVRNNRRRLTINQELERQNTSIREQKEALSATLIALREREKELEEANKAKDVFFSIIAHDLKNPSGALMGLSGLLKDYYTTYTPEELNDTIGHIASASERIYKLLENLLEWSRTQTNRIDIRPVTFDIIRLIMKNIQVHQLLSDRKSIVVEPPEPGSILVLADEGMVDFVIRNLLSNAIKYVHTGGRIRFSVTRRGPMVEILISDNGVGITEANLGLLFRIDGKVRTPGTENETGTGLGLIICREFVERNGGSIHAESRPGEGSRFRFTLPASETPVLS